MKTFHSLVVTFICGFTSIQTQAEENIPVDRPIQSTQSDMERMVAPYVEMSRRTYPSAKARFLEGLPAGYTFYVTIPIQDEQAKTFEQVFLRVESISNDTITGKIASETQPSFKYKRGDSVTCKESEVRDWTISNPNGSEEGNYVGKFLDVVQDERVPLIIKVGISEDGTPKSAQFQSAINRYKQDVSFCIPDSVKREAEQKILEIKQSPQGRPSEKFAYVIYNVVTKTFEDPKPKQ